MAFGRGKVILLGEHAVVYGVPALAAGLDRGVESKATPHERDLLVVEEWSVATGPEGDGSGKPTLGDAFGAILADYDARLGPDRPKVRVELHVGIPAGAGLGASAALGVAVIAALDEFYGVPRTPTERGSFSLAWEKVFHGNPSGVDNAVVAIGGVVYFRKGQPIEPVAVGAPLHLVIAHSGESSSTTEIVAGVAARREADTAGYDASFARIGALAEEARVVVAAGDTARLGALMNANQEELVRIGIDTEALVALCARALEAGALGAKITGAGGGGCMVALTRDAASADEVAEALAPLASLCFVTQVQAS